MSGFSVRKYWKVGVGLKVVVRWGDLGVLEGYIITGKPPIRKRLKHIDAGAETCGKYADEHGIDKVAYIAWIHVDENVRGSGLGGQLIELFERAVEDAGVDYILLIANTEKGFWTKLFRFYRRLGFKLYQAHGALMHKRMT
jgi:ribosomal protein S18 acetylase RimI-like enzyme